MWQCNATGGPTLTLRPNVNTTANSVNLRLPVENRLPFNYIDDMWWVVLLQSSPDCVLTACPVTGQGHGEGIIKKVSNCIRQPKKREEGLKIHSTRSDNWFPPPNSCLCHRERKFCRCRTRSHMAATRWSITFECHDNQDQCQGGVHYGGFTPAHLYFRQHSRIATPFLAQWRYASPMTEMSLFCANQVANR